MKTTQISPLAAVQQIYTWFGEGNIPAILDMLTENVLWKHAGDHNVIPFAGTFHGKAGALDFFQKLGGSYQITEFEPHNFSENGLIVTNDVHVSGTVISTEKTARLTSHFTWMFNEEGKVFSWEMTGDTHELDMAFH